MKIRLLAMALLVAAAGCEPGQEAPDNEAPAPEPYPARQPQTQPPGADTILAPDTAAPPDTITPLDTITPPARSEGLP